MPAAGDSDLFDPATMDTDAVARVLATSTLAVLVASGVALFHGSSVRARDLLGAFRRTLMATALLGRDLSRHGEQTCGFGGTVHDARL